MPTEITSSLWSVAPDERCQEGGCRGARLEGAHCLEHLRAEEFDAAVVRLCAGEPLDVRDTTIDAERLQALLEALTKDDGGRPVLPDIDSRGAIFSGVANFVGATFSGDADFAKATFSGVANFARATFTGNARFVATSFVGDAGFGEAVFGGQVVFAAATFGGDAVFAEATFGDAFFERGTFSGYARFNGTSFSGSAVFTEANFSGNATFGGATFSGVADFGGATFTRGARFVHASFERARQLGPLVVRGQLALNDCVFAERVNIEVAASNVCARGATFAAAVHLRVRWAQIALDDADFARPSTLAGAMTWRPKADLPDIVDVRPIELEPRPRLITLRGAHVAELSLSDVDLRACRFFGAHGLESLSIEAGCIWPHTPSTLRYSDRETIAEEHRWREEHGWRSGGWDQPSTQPPQWLEGRGGREQLQPPQIAELYRALRKAREEDKDQAGAGDLYYGEMEMRRRTSLPARGERGRVRARSDRAILTAYWVVCGYGLKASRALLALLTIIIAASFGLQAWGFTPDASYTRALVYSIESTSSLFRVPNAPGLELTYAGEGIQIALRILGPLLIGLALLALRARVKR